MSLDTVLVYALYKRYRQVMSTADIVEVGFMKLE